MKGSCLCRAVTWQTEAEAGPPAACHCSQCRKQSGHVWASSWVPDAALSIQGEVRWYEASPGIKRGFCPICGSFLFWKDPADPFTCFSMGSIDGPSGMSLSKHIHVAAKGDYYNIADGVPQEE